MRITTKAISGFSCVAAGASFADEALYEKAYILGLPIIMSDKTMYYYSVDESADQYKAPFDLIKNTA